jgi:hypothetical protein
LRRRGKNSARKRRGQVEPALVAVERRALSLVMIDFPARQCGGKGKGRFRGTSDRTKAPQSILGFGALLSTRYTFWRGAGRTGHGIFGN